MQPQISPSLHRLSELEEDEEDGDDDDVEEGCADDVLDNVSKNSTASSEFKCHAGAGVLKHMTYSCTTDTMPPLRKRRNVATAAVKMNKSKCVQFTQLPNRNDESPRSTLYSTADLSEQHSGPLKKIIFNGTFPIDDPYSSRF